jgi:hypothetical protein
MNNQPSQGEKWKPSQKNFQSSGILAFLMFLTWFIVALLKSGGTALSFSIAAGFCFACGTVLLGLINPNREIFFGNKSKRRTFMIVLTVGIFAVALFGASMLTWNISLYLK